MKKTISLLLALVMSLSLVGVIGVSAAEVYDGTSVSASLSGAGTEADPYLIANGADLAFFAANPVDGASYKLTDDVVWSSYTNGAEAPAASNWTPVTFNGTFDGDGHSISGIYMKGDKTAAFFATATGTIKNLTVQDSYFEGTKYVSAIVGQQVAGSDKAAMPALTIDNCVNFAELCLTKKDGLLGSMVGDAFGNANKDTFLTVTITNCVNYGNITTTPTGTVYVGGLVGRIFGCPAVVDSCANFGNIDNVTVISGGIVGQSGINGYAGDTHKTTISNCYNAGNISATRICGGIIGRAYPGTEVTACVNVGNVTGTIADAAKDGYYDQYGPIVGHGPDTRAEAEGFVNCGPITNCYTSADAVISSANDATSVPFYASAATVKTVAELNSADMVALLGDAWTIADGALTLKVLVTEPEVVEPEVTEPEVTEPEVTEPEVTEPDSSTDTGDSAIIFAVVAAVSILGVAFIAKRREN